MLKRLICTGAVLAVLAATLMGSAAADTQPVVSAETPLPTFNGGFSPTALPKTKLSPIALNLTGDVAPLAKTRPPALQEIVLEIDKNVTFDARGMPLCPPVNVESAPSTERCRPALVGRGKTDVEVEFPEQEPFIAEGKLFAFNGGVKGGTTTIHIYAYLSAPVSSAVVWAAKVSKIHNGRYGSKAIVSIPKIAGGYGSVKEFSLTIRRTFAYGGERQSYLSAKCPDGHLSTRVTGFFADGSEVSDRFVRACTPKG
jgi:hypothetical protein